MQSHELRLSMQRALWGEVTPKLRSVSGEADPTAQLIRLCFVFESEPNDVDRECASSVAAEVSGDLYTGWTLEEEYRVISPPDQIHRLKELAYLRHELA
jgi:hypothetical protein